MADTTTKIVSELDFEKIKAAISSFIANNSDFTDYNFDGSALSTLTDILAYNTHYNSLYLNMALNENFIDTAVLRSSLVSLAKNFGYTPKSIKSSKTNISFIIRESDPTKLNGNAITLTTLNYFNSNNNGTNYIFVPTQYVTAVSSSGYYTFTNVELREGSYVTINYTAQGLANEKFLINTPNVDLDSVAVTVQNSYTDTTTTIFSQISDITTLSPTSTIYYLFESPTGGYEISFGDGVLGQAIQSGNIVNITYQVSSGAGANGCTAYVLSNSIDGRFTYSSVTLTTALTSYGGAAAETSDSIRINALQNLRTQGRAVTVEDYKFFLTRDYPLAKSISVWGGQDNVPPIYGKVFISFKPATGFVLSNAEKQNILTNIIQKYNIISVLPEIIDPEYTFILVKSIVKYNSRATTNTPDAIKALVAAEITNYNNTYLTQFGTFFNYSDFITNINKTDTSIISNITTVAMKKHVSMNLNTLTNYSIQFQNKIVPGSLSTPQGFQAITDSTLGLTSDTFYLDDDSAGNVRVYKFVSGQKVVIKNTGTIDYINGIVSLASFKPSSVVNVDNTLDIICTPVEFDINSSQHIILDILDTDVSIEVRAE